MALQHRMRVSPLMQVIEIVLMGEGRTYPHACPCLLPLLPKSHCLLGTAACQTHQFTKRPSLSWPNSRNQLLRRTNAVLLLFTISHHVLSSFRFERHCLADHALCIDSNRLMSCQFNNIGEVHTYHVSAFYSAHRADSWHDADRHAKHLLLGDSDGVRYYQQLACVLTLWHSKFVFTVPGTGAA